MNLQPPEYWRTVGESNEAQQERLASLQDQAQLAKKRRGVPNAMQVGSDHYSKKAIQPWDYIVSNNLGYLEGNVVKYVSRWKDKGGIDDLRKAQHYIHKLIEIAEG